MALEREFEGEAIGPVPAPRYPGRKDEGWWCVVGDTANNRLLAIKRVPLNKTAKVGGAGGGSMSGEGEGGQWLWVGRKRGRSKVEERGRAGKGMDRRKGRGENGQSRM